MAERRVLPIAEAVVEDIVRVRAVGAVDTLVAAVFFIGVEMLGEEPAPEV